MSHGANKRIDVIAPRSKFYQGPFGRLCNDLTPWVPPGGTPKQVDDFLLDFANTHMVERPGLKPGDLADPATVAEMDAEFGTGKVDDPSTGIPAAYTYFGQFVDHDITFDTASSLQRQNDPNAILNFRTPRLDLDNVYGKGPDDQPYLYDGDDKAKMLIGHAVATDADGMVTGASKLRDLPRNGQGRALIGDMRNDENSMVSQLQLAFLLAHNTLVDRARAKGLDDPFEKARTTLRWLYQWVVWNDFLKRVTHDQIHSCAMQMENLCFERKGWKLGMKDIYSWKHHPYMPIEFSVAAYRFGHSMVRNAYQTNHPHRGFGTHAPIFDNTDPAVQKPDDLRGFRPMEERNTLQWDWFLHMTTSGGPFPQRARKIDTKLSNALAALHEGPAGDPLNVLAFRNLKRGAAFGLPGGTDIARKWCMATHELKDHDIDSLWYYILAESGGPSGKHGNMLGRMGSTIVCATFAGLLKGDPNSWVNMAPCWTPDDADLLCPGVDNVDAADNGWELSSIIRIAGLPVEADDVTDQTAGNYPDTVGCI